jgi:hypothetical protein
MPASSSSRTSRPVRIFHVRVTGPATNASPLNTSSHPVLPPGTEPRFPNGAHSAEKVAYPGKVLAFTNIPIRVPTHFMGRDDALAVIETALKRYEGCVAITALHGLRGVGKTTLAAAFAERHRGDYRATWWIRAQADSTMRADLVALGIRLSWVGADEKEEPAVAAVMERLRYEGDRIAHLRQCGGCRRAQTLFATRRGRPGARYLKRPCLAWGGSAGRNTPVAQGDRR